MHAGLGDARTILNVGAGSGNDEPADRQVLAVEPSAAMRAQRPAGGLWHSRHRQLRTAGHFPGSLRLIRSLPE